MQRVFILSPARTDGKRASLLFNADAQFDAARRLRSTEGMPLGEVFSFLSGLYFRGKLAYTRRFARPPHDLSSGYVITSSRGLVDIDEKVTLDDLRRFAEVPIDIAEPLYRHPLQTSVAALQQAVANHAEVVLLGSIATNKYVDVLLEAFGRALLFPTDFIGRGDMSRGGLMLRCARDGIELPYAPVALTTVRTGKRPPKLDPQR